MSDHKASHSASAIPCSVPDLRGNEQRYLRQCVEDNWVSSAGPFVTEFERQVAELVGVEHAIATMNGTAALHLALVVGGVKPGDEVVVPDWTFAATANAVHQAGAQPVFVDVCPHSWALDPDRLEQVLRVKARSIRVVVVVHALGTPADLARLSEICERYQVLLIEDAAGALGAHCAAQAVGAVGTLAIFSFNGNKIATAGGGGMVVTRSQELAERARRLSTQSRQSERYWHDEPAFNYRMTNVNAAIGVAQLERLPEMLAARQRIHECYTSALASRLDMRMGPTSNHGLPNYWLSAVRCADAHQAQSLCQHLREHHIDGRPFWHSLSAMPAYASVARWPNPVSAGLSGAVVTLPCSSQLQPDEQARVLRAIAVWQGRPVTALPGVDGERPQCS